MVRFMFFVSSWCCELADQCLMSMPVRTALKSTSERAQTCDKGRCALSWRFLSAVSSVLWKRMSTYLLGFAAVIFYC